MKKWIMRKLPLILLLSLLVNAAYVASLYKQSRVYSKTYEGAHLCLVHVVTNYNALSPDQIDEARKDVDSSFNSSLLFLHEAVGHMRAMRDIAEASGFCPPAVHNLYKEIFVISRGYLMHPDEFEYYTARLNSLVQAGKDATRPDGSYDLEKLWSEHWERLLDLGVRY